MKNSKLNTIILFLFVSAFTFTSCNDDDDDVHNIITQPITAGSNVTVTNTFQYTAFTSDAEVAIEDLFQVPTGSLAANANIGSGIEFSSYLLNLYDIDIDKNTIKFNVVAEANDPNYGTLFRVLESNTFDRYYLTFNETQNVSGFTSSNSSVNLRIDSSNVLVVEIGEGYDFNPDQSFTITLN